MHAPAFLIDLVVVLGAALIVLLVSRRLRIPSILGFMLTGILIGPHGLGAVSDTEQVEALAEIGVALLLFSIGIELSLSRLREFRRAFFFGGSLQVTLTVAAGTLIVSQSVDSSHALLAGCLLALSSTAMVFRLLVDRAEVSSAHGRVMTGILLFQDFAMVPMIAIVPALAGGPGGSGPGRSLLLGSLAAIAAFVIARWLAPRALALVARSGIRELFVVGAAFFCLGSASVTGALGLSPALGAFLAGILVSESEYSHQLIADVLPFRDLFTSLFFVGIGMLLDLGFVFENLGVVSAVSVAAIAVKALILTVVVLVLGYPLRIAAIVALGLAQIGEFSFVIASLGHSQGLLSPSHYQVFLAAAVVSLCATPFLVLLAPHAAARLGWLGGRVTEEGQQKSVGLSQHVIIVGHGVNGRNLARVLKAVGVPYIALDLDGEVVRRARLAGEENIVYGDATRPGILESCNVRNAAVIVFAIADPDAARRGVSMVRSLSPHVTIIVRTLLVNQVEELRRLGADEVIPEEFETSIAIFSRVLRRLHTPSNVIRNQERLLRSEGYEFLRAGDRGTTRLMERVSSLMAAGTTETFLVEEASPADGKTIRETGLRQKTGVTIIAVVRDARATVSPPPDHRILANDVLVLVGSHQSLEDAFEALGGEIGPVD